MDLLNSKNGNKECVKESESPKVEHCCKVQLSWLFCSNKIVN